MRHPFLATLLLTLLTFLPRPVTVAADETPAFVKFDASGRELPDQAADWLMVMDQATGLTREIKTADGSRHERDNIYSWKNITGTFIKGLNARPEGSEHAESGKLFFNQLMWFRHNSKGPRIRHREYPKSWPGLAKPISADFDLCLGKHRHISYPIPAWDRVLLGPDRMGELTPERSSGYV